GGADLGALHKGGGPERGPNGGGRAADDAAGGTTRADDGGDGGSSPPKRRKFLDSNYDGKGDAGDRGGAKAVCWDRLEGAAVADRSAGRTRHRARSGG